MTRLSFSAIVICKKNTGRNMVMIGIYARVSTEEQAKKGYSLLDQVRQCKIKAGTDNVKEYIDDGHSGEFLERPGLEQLRRDVKDGIIDTVIVHDPDRWSRNLMNQLIVTDEIEKRAVIVFVNGEYDKSPEGKLFYQMRGAISEFEKAKINERMTRGRRQKARQGKVLRDFKVYGYSYDLNDEVFKVNEEEARIVKVIFQLFTIPNELVQGANGIAKYLTASGVPTKTGKKVWHRQVVRQILLNEVYIGNFYQNKYDTEGMLGNEHRKEEDKVRIKLRPKEEWILIPTPPIIDEFTFEQAQKLLAESRRRYAKDSLNQYLLSGMLRCGHCENTLTGRYTTNWGKKSFEYTDIKNTAGSKFRGCGLRVKCEEIDQKIWDSLEQKLLARIDVTSEANPDLPEKETIDQLELKRVCKEIDKVKNGREKLIDFLASGELDDQGDNAIRAKLREISEKESLLKTKKEEIEERIKKSHELNYSELSMDKAVTYYLERKNSANEELTFEDKKQLIRMCIREVRVYKDHSDIFSF
jgi:site-specific DNA recombinase